MSNSAYSSKWRDKYKITDSPGSRKCYCHCRKCQLGSEYGIGIIWEQRGERWFKLGPIEPVDRYAKV